MHYQNVNNNENKNGVMKKRYPFVFNRLCPKIPLNKKPYS